MANVFVLFSVMFSVLLGASVYAAEYYAWSPSVSVLVGVALTGGSAILSGLAGRYED